MMPSHHSAAYNARPHKEVVYWTANKAGQREIKNWLSKEVEGDGDPFYASFLNWCAAAMDKLKYPGSKYPSTEAKEYAETVRQVLRKQPLDVREFIGIMENYHNGPFQSGLKCGHIGKPHKADGVMIMEGDQKLREIVWTQRERVAMLAASGQPAPSRKMQKLVDEAILEARLLEEERQRVREEREREREEQERAQEEWKSMKEAVGGVDEEIVDEDAAAVIDGVAISEKQPWEESLVDRTRE